MNDLMIVLHAEAKFDSCHHLKNYQGECANTHGHTWFLEVWVAGKRSQLDKIGILFDFKEIKKIADSFDHKDLNKIVKFNPTCENLAIEIYERLRKVRKDLAFFIRLYESCVGKKNFVELGDFSPNLP